MRAFPYGGFLPALPALLAASAVLAGCAGSGAPAKRPPPTPVKIMRAERGDIAVYGRFDGQVAPLFNATLSSSQSGNVVAVYVNEGDRVTQGELLAKIDDGPLRQQLAQAQGQVTQAQGNLRSSALSQPIRSMGYGSSLGQAQAAVDADQAALRNAALIYQSNERLYPQGYVAQTALEQARSSYVAAQQQLQRDRAVLIAAHANLGQTQADLQSVQASRGVLEQARGLVGQLRAEIAQAEVRAPFDGVVTARLLDPGAFAGPNQPILTVSHLHTVYVDVNVPDAALAYVHQGMPAMFTSSSLPGVTFHGVIADINAVPTQGTLSYRARMRYANANDLLRGGMLVSVSVVKQERHNVVVVPRSAVAEEEGGAGVFVVREGRAVHVPVTIGVRTDTEEEIHGVQLGEPIITTLSDMLQNGSQVAVVNAGAEEK